ncbi:type II toxin-antitoxin system VapC family toxin [soil metagenome]
MLVDTNVIADIVSGDPVWFHWSSTQLNDARRTVPLHVNEITYAELAVRMDNERQLQGSLVELGITLERTPTRAVFLAGRVFGRYRSAGGPRTAILPDFFIGAHAEVADVPLLTRDVRRYRTYFPAVTLVTPSA